MPARRESGTVRGVRRHTKVKAGVGQRSPKERTWGSQQREEERASSAAPAFGVRRACSRFRMGQQRRQAGRTPNASRRPESFGAEQGRDGFHPVRVTSLWPRVSFFDQGRGGTRPYRHQIVSAGTWRRLPASLEGLRFVTLCGRGELTVFLMFSVVFFRRQGREWV